MNLSADIRQQLLQRLAKASEAGITVDQMTEATSLRDDLKLDSLEMVTLVFDLQDELGVTIEDDELPSIATVGNLLQIVELKLATVTDVPKKTT